MKLLLVKFVFCCTAALAAPADKQKRDILPGDPRYGTEHHHHHDHQHENEVQILKAAGGYIGSYTVPDDIEDHSFQVQPQVAYGPPSHTPGTPFGTDLFAPSDTIKNPASIFVPSTSYGIPDTTQILNNNYLGPVIDDKKPIDIKTTVLDLNTDYQAPSVQAPITSYDVKHEELVNVPQTSYGTPVVKTTIQEQPLFDTVHVQKTVIPEVQHEIHHVQQPAVVHKHVETIPHTVSLPQVKVTASHVPTETQGVVQHSVPSITSAISSFPNYNSYASYSNIPLKTVDHHVQVHVPQPYHVPVTKHVAIPIPVPHRVEVPKPYYVRVPQPVQVTVDRPYPVEVPRPVPYPVPQYVKTNYPVAHQHHVTVDTKANPFQTFFDNTQTSFQNVLSGVPTFGNPLEGFQNPFENFDFSSFPPLSFIPSSLPSFIPQQPQTAVTTEHINVPSPTNSDTVTVDNPVLKPETTVTKTHVIQPIKTVQQTQQVYKPSTACAGCIVTSATSKQDYVQPTDANGGYVY